MSLIPDEATFHQYLTISNGQIGFTPEARTSPYADHFYPPGWNIVPNRGAVSYNPLTVATWLMGTMPGMEGVSRNEYMLKDDTEDAIVAESLPSNGSFEETGAVLPTKDASVIEQAVTMNSTKFGEEDVAMEDTMPYEGIVSPPEYEPFEDTEPTTSAIDEKESRNEGVAMEDAMSSGSFEETEPAKDTVSRKDNVIMDLEVIDNIERTYDAEHLEATVFDAAVPKDTVKDNVLKEDTLSKFMDVPIEDTELMETTVNEDPVPTVVTKGAVDVPDTVSSQDAVPNRDSVPTTSPKSRKRKICSVCSSTESKQFIKGLCLTCYRYQLRTDKPRPLTLNYQRREEKSCSNCLSTEQYGFIKGLCAGCYRYQIRTNKPRPLTVIINHGKEKTCSKCSSTKQTGFRKGLCATCYMYQYRHDEARQDAKRVKDGSENKKCSNCAATESKRWLSNQSRTGILCANCYHYEHRHNAPRPSTMFW